MRHRIGLVADVQYADIPATWDFAHTVKRRYRHALSSLSRAVDVWKAAKVDLVVDLGDTVDGRNRDLADDASLTALRAVMKEFHKLEPIPTFHLIGNHDLNNFTRSQLVSGLFGSEGYRCANPAGHSYYSFPINSKWRGVVLDGYEESLLTLGGGRVGNELTLDNGGIPKPFFDMCQKHNPNDLSLYNVDFFRGVAPGVDMRWVSFNGALSEAQLGWLADTLGTAEAENQHVCIFSHIVAHPQVSPGCRTLFWNFDKLLEILHAHASAKLFIAGHAHKELYHVDSHTHHLTLPSPLEVQTDNCCAVLSLGEDGSASLEGHGMQDRVFID